MSKTTAKFHDTHVIADGPVSVWRTIVFFCVWLFWLLLLGAAVLLAYGWTHRYDYLEQGTKHVLAERNIAGDLDIVSVTGSGMRLENVALRSLGASDEVFFQADIIEARYEWREALDGKIDALTFTRPKAVIEIDETGKMIAGWVPPTQSDNESELTFPKEGFVVKNGHVTIKSPYGELASSVEATLYDRSRFDVDLNIAPTRLTFNDMSSRLGGPLSVMTTQGDRYNIISDLNLVDFTTPALEANTGTIKSDLLIKTTDGQWEMDGPVSVELDDVVSGASTLSALSIVSHGEIRLPMETESNSSILANLNYRGDVDMNVETLSAFDETRRTALASTLSFYDILQKSPILKEYSPALKEQVATVLSGSDIKAKFAVVKQGQDVTLSAREDVVITKGGSQWHIQKSAKGPLVDIDPQDDDNIGYSGVSYFNFVKSAPLPLQLNNAVMNFGLTSAASFAGVSHFEGGLSLPQRWSFTGPQGDLTHLSVGSADMSFARAGERSQFTAKTDFNVTGTVPGGDVTEFAGRGHVVIDTKLDSTRLEFTASDPLVYKRVDLTSGWILEDGQLSLASPLVMTGPAERRTVDVTAKDLTMRIYDGDVRDFQTDIAEVRGTGLLTLKDEGLTQEWALDLTDGHMTSADFPIENTDIFTPNAAIKTHLIEGQAPVFDIDSPVMKVSSALVSADEIAVHMSGTPDNLIVDYDAKLFRFSDPSLPQIPMAGQTRLVGTQWTGNSIARLPEDPTTPIDISFTFEDGAGTADVNIETLNFTRTALQPQSLVKNLQGKIGDVEGSVSTAIKLEFGEGQELKSYGTTTFNNLDFGILSGTVEGVNGELEFASFFPLETSGRQTLKLRSFDAGFPLPNGEIEFELLPGKMKIHRAEWPVGEGLIFIEPMVWDFEMDENRVVLAVENVIIQDVLQTTGSSKLEITGAMSGRLPILVSGVNVDVEEGTLSVPSGGSISFNHTGTDLAGAQNQAVGVAFDALKDFKYDIFELDVNGPLDGVVRLRTVFSGANEDVYAGQPFEFDVELEGELLNLMRNLNPKTHRDKILGGDYYDLVIQDKAQDSRDGGRDPIQDSVGE